MTKRKVLQEGEVFLIEWAEWDTGKFYKIYSKKLTLGLALTMDKRPMPLMSAEAGFQHNTVFGSRALHMLPMPKAGLTARWLPASGREG